MPGESARIRGGIATLSREASRVAERTNIREIRLVETSAELKSVTTAAPLSWVLGFTSSAHYKEGDRFFVLSVEYRVTIEKSDDPVTDDQDKETEEVANISFQLGVLCELEQDDSGPEIRSEEVDEYADAAAMIVLSPYVREYLHDVTMRMGLPPLVMDVLPSFAEPEHADADRGARRVR